MEIKVKSEKQNLKHNGNLFNLIKKYDVHIDNKLVKNLSNVNLDKSGTIFLVERNFFNRKTWVFYLILFIIFFLPLLILNSALDVFFELLCLRFDTRNDKVEVIKLDYENINKRTIDIYIDNNICLVKGVENYNVIYSTKKIAFAKLKVILFYIFNILFLAIVVTIIICYIIYAN